MLVVIFGSFASQSLIAYAGDKNVIIESVPSGAQVDVNGSITCTTPCTLHVSSAYFGAKRTALAPT